MSSKRTAAAQSSEVTIIIEPPPMEDLEDTTAEDYKALNDKLDGVITKIKSRKDKRKKI